MSEPERFRSTAVRMHGANPALHYESLRSSSAPGCQGLCGTAVSCWAVPRDAINERAAAMLLSARGISQLDVPCLRTPAICRDRVTNPTAETWGRRPCSAGYPDLRSTDADLASAAQACRTMAIGTDRWADLLPAGSQRQRRAFGVGYLSHDSMHAACDFAATSKSPEERSPSVAPASAAPTPRAPA